MASYATDTHLPSTPGPHGVQPRSAPCPKCPCHYKKRHCSLPLTLIPKWLLVVGFHGKQTGEWAGCVVRFLEADEPFRTGISPRAYRRLEDKEWHKSCGSPGMPSCHTGVSGYAASFPATCSCILGACTWFPAIYKEDTGGIPVSWLDLGLAICRHLGSVSENMKSLSL